MTQENIRIPELLAPAGNREKLETALRYGADAVYLGGKGLNLRAGAGGFTFPEVGEAVRYAAEKKASVYYCLNGYPQEHELEHVRSYLKELHELSRQNCAPAALIVADFGVVQMAKEICPEIPLHISTQANTGNSAAVRFWAGLGAPRVNVAREVSAPDLKAMKEACPDTELEVFVHGAMCMSLSGRCFLSAWLNDRSGNMGACTHPCRFEYTPMSVTVAERTRPDEPLWTVEEHPGGGTQPDYTKFFAAHDQCLIGHLPEICRYAAAIKIEGRTKTSSYLAQVIDAYRCALDDIRSGCFDPAKYLPQLLNTATRPYSTGFYGQNPRQAFAQPPEAHEKKNILARIISINEDGSVRMAVKCKWEAAQNAVLLACGGKHPVLTSGSYTLLGKDGEPAEFVNPGLEATLKTDNPEILPLLQEGLFFRSI